MGEAHIGVRTVDSRQLILDASVRLFGEHGYEGTSLQAIADAVGMRKQSLLHYFRSKEDLRQAAAADLLAHWQRELPRLLTGTTSGHDRFGSTISALVDFFLEDGQRAKFAIREMLDRPDESRELAASELRQWTDLIVDFIRMGQKAGFVKEDVDPESYIILIMTMVVGTVAFAPVASAIAKSSDHRDIAPRVNELVRIARESYFVETDSSKQRRGG